MVRSQAGCRKRWRLGFLAIVSAAVAYAAVVPGIGWNQGSHYALVKSLYSGSARVDSSRRLTGDVAYMNGHFYSTKAPGLAFASMPAYAALRVTGAEQAIVHHSSSIWKASRVTIWGLTLWSVVVPAALLLLLVQHVADRVEPGFGTAAAATLGLATLVLPFATLFFAHILSAFLGFAAFAVLWREKESPRRLRLVAVAGLLVGLAVTTEYSLALVGLVLGCYALVRRQERIRRAAVYAAGAAIGIAPLLLYNRLAFGSVLHLSYAHAVSVPGGNGHAVLGANSKGFFGVGLPSPRTAIELLFASRGLLTVTPVLAMGGVGTMILFRRGRRAEALVVGAVAVSFLIFNAGYFLPFGGWVPGPRLLIPVLPFLAFPLGIAYRRYPGPTLALAVASAAMLVSATATLPLLPSADNTSQWADRIRSGEFQDTVAMFAGVRHGWLAVVPFAVPVLVAMILTVLATGRVALGRQDTLSGLTLLAVWALGASLVIRVGAAPRGGALVLVACAAGLSVLAVGFVALASGSGRPRNGIAAPAAGSG